MIDGIATCILFLTLAQFSLKSDTLVASVPVALKATTAKYPTPSFQNSALATTTTTV
jgi:hypothetical protein